MKSLKLKKVKISKIGNPHILFGGAETAQNANGANQNTFPDTTGNDTRLDGDCAPKTNGETTVGRTDRIPLEAVNNGIN